MSWEERMAAKAVALRDAEDRARLARLRAEVREHDRAAREQAVPTFLTGPPEGCQVCHRWERHFYLGAWNWVHVNEGPHVQVVDGEHWCHHDCHSEPFD